MLIPRHLTLTLKTAFYNKPLTYMHFNKSLKRTTKFALKTTGAISSALLLNMIYQRAVLEGNRQREEMEAKTKWREEEKQIMKEFLASRQEEGKLEEIDTCDCCAKQS